MYTLFCAQKHARKLPDEPTSRTALKPAGGGSRGQRRRPKAATFLTLPPILEESVRARSFDKNDSSSTRPRDIASRSFDRLTDSVPPGRRNSDERHRYADDVAAQLDQRYHWDAVLSDGVVVQDRWDTILASNEPAGGEHRYRSRTKKRTGSFRNVKPQLSWMDILFKFLKMFIFGILRKRPLVLCRWIAK